MFFTAVDSSWTSFDRVRVHFYSLNTLILAMAEEDYLVFFTGEGERGVERTLKKSQVTTERLAQMFGLSHKAEALTLGSFSNDDGDGSDYAAKQ